MTQSYKNLTFKSLLVLNLHCSIFICLRVLRSFIADKECRYSPRVEEVRAIVKNGDYNGNYRNQEDCEEGWHDATVQPLSASSYFSSFLHIFPSSYSLIFDHIPSLIFVILRYIRIPLPLASSHRSGLLANRRSP